MIRLLRIMMTPTIAAIQMNRITVTAKAVPVNPMQVLKISQITAEEIPLTMTKSEK